MREQIKPLQAVDRANPRGGLDCSAAAGKPRPRRRTGGNELRHQDRAARRRPVRDRARGRGRPLHRARVQAAAPRRHRQGRANVVVDFTDTTFIDSTTLGVLVGGVKRLRQNDGPALARLQRPQHHEDLRDHRPRPRLHDLQRRAPRPSTRLGASGRRRRRVLRSPLAARALAARLAATGCGSGGRVARPPHRTGQGALHRGAVRLLPRSPTRARRGRSGPTSTRPSGTSREDGLGFEETTIARSCATRSRIPVGDPSDRAPGMPADLVTGHDADDVAAYVACVGRPGAGRADGPAPRRWRARPAAAAARRRRRRTAAVDRDRRLRQLPHARGAGSSGDDRPEPRRGEAERKELAVDPRHERQGRHAVVQGQLSEQQIDAVADYLPSEAAPARVARTALRSRRPRRRRPRDARPRGRRRRA